MAWCPLLPAAVAAASSARSRSFSCRSRSSSRWWCLWSSSITCWWDDSISARLRSQASCHAGERRGKELESSQACRGSGHDRHLTRLMFDFTNLTQVQGHSERSKTNSEGTDHPGKVRWHFYHRTQPFDRATHLCKAHTLCGARNVPLALLKTEAARQEHFSGAENNIHSTAAQTPPQPDCLA